MDIRSQKLTWAQVSWKAFNRKMLSILFWGFAIISPWEMMWPFIWTNVHPLLKDALCQVCLKLAQWFWRKRWKCEKFTDIQTTDNQKSLLELRWVEKHSTEKITQFKIHPLIIQGKRVKINWGQIFSSTYSIHTCMLPLPLQNTLSHWFIQRYT